LPPFAVGGAGINAEVESFGSVWDMASTPAGTPARIAVYLLLLMVGCLLAPTVWPHVLALPVINGIAAKIVGALLVTRPRTGEPPPDLSAIGKGQLVVAVGITLVSAIHIGHLVSQRRRAALVAEAMNHASRQGHSAMSADTGWGPQPAGRSRALPRFAVAGGSANPTPPAAAAATA
jgi:hypothetical protein